MKTAGLQAGLLGLLLAGCASEQQIVTTHHATIGEILVGTPPPWCQVVVRDATGTGAVLYLVLPSPEMLEEIKDSPCSPQSILKIDRKAFELANQQGRKGFTVEDRRAYATSRDGKVQPQSGETNALPPVTVMVSTVRFTD